MQPRRGRRRKFDIAGEDHMTHLGAAKVSIDRSTGAAHRLLKMGGIVAALLWTTPAASQEFAYCDLSVAQQAGKLQLNGNAAIVSTGPRNRQGIQVTPEDNSQGGSIFHRVPIDFAPGTSLYQHFRVRISGSGPFAPPGGADGFAFMVQNDPSGLGALGELGDGTGYLGITKSLALELDTYQNGFPQDDPDGNHLALLLGGLNYHHVGGDPGAAPYAGQSEGSTVSPFEPILLGTSLESDDSSYDTRDVWIDYICSGTNNCSLNVYMTFNNTNVAGAFADSTIPATLPSKPGTPILHTTGLSDISTYLGGATGYAGFAASTGGAADEHLVTYWVLSRQPLPDSNTNSLEDLCDCVTNAGTCGGNVPICDTSTGTGFCRDCSSDNECVTKDATKPYCDLVSGGGSGACGACTLDAQCGPSTPICNTVTHACTTSCSDDG